MKKTLIAMFALAGVAMAADPVTNTVNLSDLMSVESGIMIGGRNNTGSATENSSEVLPDFTTMSAIVTATNTWYTNHNWSDVGNEASLPSDKYGITMVTDGPNTNGCQWIAFAYELSADTLAGMAEANSDLALTFNVKVSGGNNKKSQTISFFLLSSASGLPAADVYGNGTGTTITGKETAPKDVTLTLSAAKVAQLAAPGTKQNLIFLMYDEDLATQTNEAWTITNMKLTYKTPAPVVPEPATATLSLLALAGLAARRRRH